LISSDDLILVDKYSIFYDSVGGGYMAPSPPLITVRSCAAFLVKK